ncbi:hypothetical protein P9139_17355 [Curtobacterium flaccumfaciens]|nr:hypothetical protein P9139_17355 [Curtobacterium flaccumfaciens]
MQVGGVAGDLVRRERQHRGDGGEHEPERPRRHDVPREDEHGRGDHPDHHTRPERHRAGVLLDRQRPPEVDEQARHEVQVPGVRVQERVHRPECDAVAQEDTAVLGQTVPRVTGPSRHHNRAAVPSPSTSVPTTPRTARAVGFAVRSIVR